MNGRAVATIARFTLIEQSNRRHLWWIAGIAFALVCGLALIGSFVHVADLTTDRTAGLFAEGAARYYVLIVLVVLGLGLVRGELDSGVASLILSRPVSRREYVLGRYLGNAVVLTVPVAVMGLGSFLVVAFGGARDWTLLYDFVVLAYNACIFLSLVTLFGVLMGTVGAVAVGGFCYYALGSGTTYLLAAFVDSGTVSGPGAGLMRLVIVLLPHVLSSPLTAGVQSTLGDTTVMMRGPTFLDLIWSFVWLVGPLAATVWLLRRRDL